MRHKPWLAAVIAVVVLVGGAAVAVTLPLGARVAHRMVEVFRGDPPPEAPVPIETADLGGTGPGTLVSATTMPAIQARVPGRQLQSARVVYRSTNGDTGKETVVSGAVFTPVGQPPPGGWPIISFGHGTTGIDEECGPSVSDSLLGLTGPMFALVKLGYAVALADYQGLGQPGVHPYTDAKTAGLNMIDAVRALRHTFGNTSTRWLALGGSQGGGASWAADEQAATYSPELELVGAVADSPAADVTRIVDKAQARTLTDDQRPAFLAIVESLARLHPDLDRDDYRRGAAARYWDVTLSCAGNDAHLRDDALTQVTADDIRPESPVAADRLRALVARWALPQRRLSAPLSVAYGGADTYIDATWTTDAIARACALGGNVEWDLQPDKGHGDVEVAYQLAWISDRFAGKPAANECP
ncbi:putative lipase [Mycobacterium antarcticum]|uniref:lipase family protein n=1 Tax=Mycolicibacterium sp. TUM20985 TaxID=3023370 RepID=UPI002574116D|nr:lipase family protein [Mycolicibacterium sp. TUM20985]BDX33874.1 putative lipase [Mycolicibacterium sp. TUM20985]